MAFSLESSWGGRRYLCGWLEYQIKRDTSMWGGVENCSLCFKHTSFLLSDETTGTKQNSGYWTFLGM